MRKYKALSFRQLYSTITENNFDEYEYEERMNIPTLSSGFDHIQIKESDTV